MKYIVQSSWGFPVQERVWKTFGNDPDRRFDDLEKAKKILIYGSNLSRIVCCIRVVDETGKEYARYDPEEDTRLPGCRHRLIEKAAYYLWEKAGKPENSEQEFWLQAERELKESNEVFIL